MKITAKNNSSEKRYSWLHLLNLSHFKVQDRVFTSVVFQLQSVSQRGESFCHDHSNRVTTEVKQWGCVTLGHFKCCSSWRVILAFYNMSFLLSWLIVMPLENRQSAAFLHPQFLPSVFMQGSGRRGLMGPWGSALIGHLSSMFHNGACAEQVLKNAKVEKHQSKHGEHPRPNTLNLIQNLTQESYNSQHVSEWWVTFLPWNCTLQHQSMIKIVWEEVDSPQEWEW